MAGFTNVNDYIEAVASLGQYNEATFHKVGTAPEATGTFYSFWKDVGMPGAGSNPAAGSGTPGAGGTAYDLDADGLWAWADVEGGGKERYLAELELIASQPCTLFLYDRLVGVGGLAINSTGNKNCNTVALPRYTDGIGVECWLEFSTASTATVGSITLNSYTDTDDNTGQTGTAQAMPAAATNVGTLVRMPLAAGDRGLKAVATINVGTATTNGVVNLLLMKRIAAIPIATNSCSPYNLLTHVGRLPRLYDGFTPMMVLYSQNGNAVTIQGTSVGAYL